MKEEKNDGRNVDMNVFSREQLLNVEKEYKNSKNQSLDKSVVFESTKNHTSIGFDSVGNTLLSGVQ